MEDPVQRGQKHVTQRQAYASRTSPFHNKQAILAGRKDIQRSSRRSRSIKLRFWDWNDQRL